MKRWTLVLAICAGVAGVTLAGCSSDDAETTETTAAALDTTTTVASETTTTAVATTTTTEAMDPDAACVDCHTNQETLLALAVEPVDAESLSSGEG
jgi:hypothetical protein